MVKVCKSPTWPSGFPKRFLQRLINDKARQILVDTIEDPELMTELLGRARGQAARSGGEAGIPEAT